MAILVFFGGFLWDKMAKLGPIDFTIGLPINIDVNDGHIKFEVHILKKRDQNPIFSAQNGPAATLAHDFKWA